MRTVKESLALADEDLDVLTSFLDGRTVAGDATLTDDLVAKGRQLAARRGARVLTQLADAAELRRVRPGPRLRDARARPQGRRGGLRDLQALTWAGFALGAGGLAGLETRGFVSASDALASRTTRAIGCSTSASRCIA